MSIESGPSMACPTCGTLRHIGCECKAPSRDSGNKKFDLWEKVASENQKFIEELLDNSKHPILQQKDITQTVWEEQKALVARAKKVSESVKNDIYNAAGEFPIDSEEEDREMENLVQAAVDRVDAAYLRARQIDTLASPEEQDAAEKNVTDSGKMIAKVLGKIQDSRAALLVEDGFLPAELIPDAVWEEHKAAGTFKEKVKVVWPGFTDLPEESQGAFFDLTKRSTMHTRLGFLWENNSLIGPEGAKNLLHRDAGEGGFDSEEAVAEAAAKLYKEAARQYERFNLKKRQGLVSGEMDKGDLRKKIYKEAKEGGLPVFDEIRKKVKTPVEEDKLLRECWRILKSLDF